MEFTVKTLSPIHIGCGYTYSGLNYIIEGGRLYHVEPDAVFSSLGGKTEIYVKWLEDQSDRLAELEKLEREVEKSKKDAIRKQKRATTSEFNLKHFCEKNQTPLDQMKQVATYNLQCKGKIFDSTDIQKFISQLEQPYLPGTEIKGAMRTAILLHLLKTDAGPLSWLMTEIKRFGDRQQRVIDTVKNRSNPNREAKKNLTNDMAEIAKKLEHRTFLSPGKEDAKYDFLKYLFISDSHRCKPEDVLCVTYAKPFNTGRVFTVFSEYCQPEVQFRFKDMTVEDAPLKKEKLGFSEIQKELISEMANVLRCCHDFTQDLLEEEIAFFKKHERNDIVGQLKHVMDRNEPSAPVLRIGKDQGYLSLTMGLLIKRIDPDLYERVLIHATKGKSYDSAHGGLLPKSRKIVHYDGKELTSGWIKLIPAGTSEQTTAHDPDKAPNKASDSLASSDSLRALQNKWKK